MPYFNTKSPLFLVPLNDNVKEEKKLEAFMNFLSRSGIENFLATSDLNHDQGRPSQLTDSLFAVILYAFSECDGSLRNIEKQCLYDVRYIHLSSQQKFRKSTIANFINDVIVPNMDAIFAAVTREIAKEMNIDPLSEIFIDGTKIEANANKYRFQWKSDNKMEKLIGQVSVFMKDNDIPFSENPSKPYSFEIGTALKYLDELLQSKGIDSSKIVTGKGKRISREERLYLQVKKYFSRMLEYEEINKICGPSRKSFYKTDKDATAMCLKDDYYAGLGSSMHAAYNVQIAVNKGIIVGFYVSQDRADSRTLPSFVAKMKEQWGCFPGLICADAGYGSLANYRFIHDNSIGNYIKYPSWEGEMSGTRPALYGFDDKENLVCLGGKELVEVALSRHPSHSDSRFYEVKRCYGCPYKKYCKKQLKKKTGSRIFEVSKDWLRYKKEAEKNLLSSKGIELRVNRSIQAEGTFGIIKQDIGYDRFRRRGIEKVSAELMLVCLGANIRKYLRFIETGVLPKFWVAPDNLQPEVLRKISYVVRKGGKKKQKKQPNEIAKKRR